MRPGGVYMMPAFFVLVTLLAVSCMDFGWKAGQFVCDGPDQCPPGFFCDLAQGYCVEGEGPDVDTDTDGDTDSDTDSDTDTGGCTSPSDCFQPECGNVSCNSDNECEYGLDGGICEITDGECDYGTCTSVGVSDPPVCEFEMDWQGCEPGEVCEGEPDYQCADGTCVDGVVGNEQRLTTNPGESHHPSVVVTDVGFSAVWIDDFSLGYGHLFFATFNSTGILVASVIQVGTAANFEYPVLVWLGAGNGYALVFQRWISSNHEVMLDYLDSGGVLSPTAALQISDGNSADSRYPNAAMGVFGSDRRLAIVWQDKRNVALYKHDAYVSVIDPDTTTEIGSNQRLTDDPRDEMWSSVVATDNGFLASITAYEEIAGDVPGQVLTRALTSEGTLEGSSHTEVTPAGYAIPPAVVAWDDVSGNAGVAWRDRRVDGEFRIMFRLLDFQGAPVGNLEDGLVVGLSHNAGWNQNGLSMYFHSSPAQEFVLAWDGVPGNYSGDVEVADLMVSRIAADGESVDSAYILCGDPGRSIWPRIVESGSVALVLWQDNRDDNTLPADGEIYAATLDCQ